MKTSFHIVRPASPLHQRGEPASPKALARFALAKARRARRGAIKTLYLVIFYDTISFQPEADPPLAEKSRKLLNFFNDFQIKVKNIKMKNCENCKKIFIALMILFILTAIFILLPRKLFAATPFGGQIQKMNFCVIPPGVWLKLGGPRGGDFIYSIGSSISYLFGPPIHIRQWLLGMAGGNAICCLDRKCHSQRTGNTILFHGSSF